MQDIYILYPNNFVNCDGCKAATQNAQRAVNAAIANGHIIPSSERIHVQIFCNNDGNGNLQPPTTSPVTMRAQFDATNPAREQVVFCARPIRTACPALPPTTDSLPDVIEYASK